MIGILKIDTNVQPFNTLNSRSPNKNGKKFKFTLFFPPPFISKLLIVSWNKSFKFQHVK